MAPRLSAHTLSAVAEVQATPVNDSQERNLSLDSGARLALHREQAPLNFGTAVF
jgi:hypothetical protein